MDDFSERLSNLYEVSRSLQTLQLEEVLRLILHGVTRTTGFDRARLYLVDWKEGVLKCAMAVGLELERARKIVLRPSPTIRSGDPHDYQGQIVLLRHPLREPLHLIIDPLEHLHRRELLTPYDYLLKPLLAEHLP